MAVGTPVDADLVITKSNGTSVVLRSADSTTYTIVAKNEGPSAVTGVVVHDPPQPACLGLAYTSSAAGGASGNTPSGLGDITDTLSLPVGASVTYLATCPFHPDTGTGFLVNWATIGIGLLDLDPFNNTVYDIDRLVAEADLQITKSDSAASVDVGTTTTYTIVATNAGPSDALDARVTDAFPPNLFCDWTCAGAAGGTCTSGGSGDIDDIVDLPVGATVTYTATCLVASGSPTITNVATIAPPEFVVDPVPANDTASDIDTVLSSIPTAGAEGLLLLAMLLGIAAVAALRALP